MLGLPGLGSVGMLFGLDFMLTKHLSAPIPATVLADAVGQRGETEFLVTQLSTVLQELKSTFGSDLEQMFLGPPTIKAAAESLEQRFKRLSARNFTHRLLLVVSSGISVDGDPRPIFRAIRDSGVTVLTCFVSDQQSGFSRLFYDDVDPEWSEGERLLWDISSRLSDIPCELTRALGPASASVALFTRTSVNAAASHLIGL